jgi:signal transduction histidine kinase
LRVRQIVRNLLTNAVRHGGPNVVVRLDVEGGAALLTLSDDGRGVPSDRADLIFEPYVGSNREGTMPASVGLGLSVARQLTRLMDGDLRYERRDGWTIFTLSLPLAAAAPVPV